jgi:mitochondrial enoyl-[acyl-carrier protein] reductase / trans-2-enoyl-CoA reductase
MLQKSRILVNFLSKRSMSNRVFQINTLKLHEHGNLEDNTLKLSTTSLKESDVNLKQNEIFVKLIAAPINPADINTIQGNYSKAAMPFSLPSVIGNEGLFEVVKVSETNKNIQKGDWVIPIESGWGTWRSHAIENQEKFLKIPKNLNKHACTTLTVNPCTAYRLLNDFKKLKPNDTVIQNGANSGVGQAVIQLGSMMNINVVNIVRKRENQNELNDYLTSLGAKYIFTEDDLRKSNQLTVDLWSKIPKPRLAFNCVGGKATSDMIRWFFFEYKIYYRDKTAKLL